MFRQDIKIANERLAQVGVRIKIDGEKTSAVPLDVMATSDIPLMTVFGAISPEAQSLITNFGTAGDVEDLHIFYCKTIKDRANGAYRAGVALTGGFTNGYGSTGSLTPACPGNANNIFVACDPDNAAGEGISVRRKIFTLAHELGHLLTDDGHYGSDYNSGDDPTKIMHNLMRRGTSETEGFGESKRLYRLQEKMIYNE